jgi:hypothetical protein
MRARSSAILAALILTSCGGEQVYPGQCGARLPGWKGPSDGYGVLAITNKVRVLRDGTLRWNGKTITEDQLAGYSAILPTMNPLPFTILEIEHGASCAVVQKTRETIDIRAKCMESGGSRCGEGAGPWATIGDVIGPNGETYKYYPDGRSEIIQPTDRQRAALKEIQNKADAALQKAEKE